VITAENTSRYGIGGIITAAATIFFAYLGFEAVSTAGAEARDPARDMPIGIIGSLLVCTALYILTSAVLVASCPLRSSTRRRPSQWRSTRWACRGLRCW
jgi:APA family basic amino acid/polyamine antiporter